MTIGNGTHRTISLDLLGTIAGALSAAGNAPATLRQVRELTSSDGFDGDVAPEPVAIHNGCAEMIDRETIKRIALEAGFTLREQQGTGRIDLNEYVYDFAERLYAEWAKGVKGSEPVGDGFKGDNQQLIACINALLDLDAAGALIPHGIGGHARSLLAACAARLNSQPAIPPGFSREGLESVAEGLDWYEKEVRVGNVTGEGYDLIESTTAYAARFIRAMLAAAPDTPKGET